MLADLEQAERTVRAWHKTARRMCDLAIMGDCKAIEKIYFDAALSLPFYGADSEPLPSALSYPSVTEAKENAVK